MIVRNLLAGLGVLSVIAATAIAVNAYSSSDFEQDRPPRLKVSYVGLDLASTAGVELLDARISRAVDEICSVNGDLSLAAKAHERRCRDAAWASVRPQVDRAIDRARHPAPGPRAPSLIDDIEEQSGSVRKSVLAALDRSFAEGIVANWYGSGAHGFVYPGPRTSVGGLSCRAITVTRRSHDEQQVLAQGLVCLSPEGAWVVPAG